jgi:catechol 2,3-dioxygenase-like lactoylglutathione lyase family enzyme
VISTPDLDRSVPFCRDLPGLKVLTKGSWSGIWKSADQLTKLQGTAARWAMLSAGNANLEIVQYDSPPPTPPSRHRPVIEHGIARICFEVTSVHRMYEDLVATGVHFDWAPQYQDDLGVTTYARDPDGNVVELVDYPDRYHEEAWQLPRRTAAPTE